MKTLELVETKAKLRERNFSRHDAGRVWLEARSLSRIDTELLDFITKVRGNIILVYLLYTVGGREKNKNKI